MYTYIPSLLGSSPTLSPSTSSTHLSHYIALSWVSCALKQLPVTICFTQGSVYVSNPLQLSCLGNPMEGELGGLQSMGSQRVRHDWSDLHSTAQSIHVDPNLPLGLCLPPDPAMCPHAHSLRVPLRFRPGNRCVCTIFLDFTHTY